MGWALLRLVLGTRDPDSAGMLPSPPGCGAVPRDAGSSQTSAGSLSAGRTKPSFSPQVYTAVYYVLADLVMLSLYCYYKVKNRGRGCELGLRGGWGHALPLARPWGWLVLGCGAGRGSKPWGRCIGAVMLHRCTDAAI